MVLLFRSGTVLVIADENCLGSWHDPAIGSLLHEERACEIPYDLWVLCTSVGRLCFWCIKNVTGMLLPFFPWNVKWGQNAHSKLISLSAAMVIKKALKPHLSTQWNLCWREVGIFQTLLFHQLACSWIWWLAVWCYWLSARRGKWRLVPLSKCPYCELVLQVIRSAQ